MRENSKCNGICEFVRYLQFSINHPKKSRFFFGKKVTSLIYKSSPNKKINSITENLAGHLVWNRINVRIKGKDFGLILL